MEDYINIARRIFDGTRYDASDEDVKRGSSGSCILVPDVFLPAICKTSTLKKMLDFEINNIAFYKGGCSEVRITSSYHNLEEIKIIQAFSCQ